MKVLIRTITFAVIGFYMILIILHCTRVEVIKHELEVATINSVYHTVDTYEKNAKLIEEGETTNLYFTTDEEYFNYFYDDVLVQLNGGIEVEFDCIKSDVKTGDLDVDITVYYKGLDNRERSYMVHGDTYGRITKKATDVAEMPAKGNLVVLDNDDSIYYRVIRTDGNNALLLRMNSLSTSKFNATNRTTSNIIEGNAGTYQQYANGTLDTYINETYYDSLSDNIKNAIVDQNITQKIYTYDNNANSVNSTYKFYANDFSDVPEASARRGATYKAIVAVGTRHAFVLDIEDIFEYYEKTTINCQELNMLFYSTNAQLNYDSWLRSGQYDNSNYAFVIRGNGGYVGYGNYKNIFQVHPAFVVDLSLVSFLEVNPNMIPAEILGWSYF